MLPLRVCSVCKLEAYTIAHLIDFKKHKQMKYGHATICLNCHRDKENKAYHSTFKHMESTKENSKRSRAKNVYGITLEEYYECMSTSTKCEICDTLKDLCYDHDHTTMQFRGVLCKSCNSGLGKLGDTANMLLKAYTYLKEKQCQNV